MARVKLIKKAGKDYPQFGIKKGDQHYVWSMKMQRGGVVRRSKTYPRQSQLTLSDYKIQAHQLNEQIEDFETDDISAIENFRDEIVSEAQNLVDEQQEKLDNMPEGFQQGSTGELIQERIDALDNFISELEGLDIQEFEEDPDATQDHNDPDVAIEDREPYDGNGNTEAEACEEILQELKGILLDVS